MRLLLFVLLLQAACFAETSTKISELTEVAAASVSSSDVIPLVNYPGTNTYKFKLSNLFSVPSLAAPSFTGVASFSNGTAAAPAITFTSGLGFYRAGANQLGIASAGRQIAYLEDNLGPGLILNPDSTNLSSYLYQNLNTAMLSISGGVGSASGASQRLYGGAHATKASLHEFYVNSTLVGSHNADGLWTLGASSGSQYHVANGQLLINGGNASDYTLKVVRGTAGVTNGAATLSIQDVTTNTTAKSAAIGLGRYDNSNKDNALIYATNDATTATMSLGGGISSLHAVTGINFYTAANSSTNIGNLVGSVSSAGLWTLGLSGGTQTHVVNGLLNVVNGIRTKVSTANISTPPTEAELISAFGTAATVGSGFTAIVNDNGGGTSEYMVWSDGTNWFHAAGTKAL